MLTDAITIRAIRDAKLLGPDVITGAIDAARVLRRPVASVLIERKLITEPALYGAAAGALGIPFIDLRTQTIDKATLEQIPASIALHRRVVAYLMTPTTLRVAMEDPEDIVTIELLRRATNREIIPALAAPGALADTLRLYRGDIESAVEELTQLSVQPEGEAKDEQSGKELHRLAEDVPVIRIVDTLLQHAISLRASDIHIEPTEQGVAVRYRIDGILRPTMTLPKTTAAGIVARINILANLKIDEHRLPQDGRFKVTTPTERLAVRVAIMPVYDGEKIVLRLLREEGKALTIADLGLRGRALDDPAPLGIVERNMRKPHGIIFVTGPTGSGKTTTLYAMMNALSTPEVNIATIEDPIEYRRPGVNQSLVNPRIGFSFAAGLRELLRQDPYIILVGEI
ncbi:Flp pilus assembly complex ATPase component TadA, partial [Candidatus Uhrbacteria bacterium]|nr:Flp pilus assembly complex ATPase component TadA [Candidatus Uhrbacteria bacterium]